MKRINNEVLQQACIFAYMESSLQNHKNLELIKCAKDSHVIVDSVSSFIIYGDVSPDEATAKMRSVFFDCVAKVFASGLPLGFIDARQEFEKVRESTHDILFVTNGEGTSWLVNDEVNSIMMVRTIVLKMKGVYER